MELNALLAAECQKSSYTVKENTSQVPERDMTIYWSN